MRNSVYSLLSPFRIIKSNIRKAQLALFSVNGQVNCTVFPSDTGPLKRH